MKQIIIAFICILFVAITSCGDPPPKSSHYLPKYHGAFKKKAEKVIWVAIAPYHEVDSAAIALVGNELEEFYGVNTLILPRAIMSDSLLAWSKTRYNANAILRFLSTVRPDHVGYILAITDDRIAACGDSLHESGVAGLGSRSGGECVVSTAALRLKLPDESMFTQRLVKACLHEMGHNFGLRHCKGRNKKCLMRDAKGTVRTLDTEEIFLCKKCRDQLVEKGINVKEFK